MELGCFLAGALVSSQGHMVTEEVMAYIEPVRDFLAIIFFASIGNCPSASQLHVWSTCRSGLLCVCVYSCIFLESGKNLM